MWLSGANTKAINTQKLITREEWPASLCVTCLCLFLCRPYFKGYLMSFIWSQQAEDKQRLPTYRLRASGNPHMTPLSQYLTDVLASSTTGISPSMFQKDHPSLLLSLYLGFQGSSLPSLESSKSSDSSAKNQPAAPGQLRGQETTPTRPHWGTRSPFLAASFPGICGGCVVHAVDCPPVIPIMLLGN